MQMILAFENISVRSMILMEDSKPKALCIPMYVTETEPQLKYFNDI